MSVAGWASQPSAHFIPQICRGWAAPQALGKPGQQARSALWVPHLEGETDDKQKDKYMSNLSREGRGLDPRSPTVTDQDPQDSDLLGRHVSRKNAGSCWPMAAPSPWARAGPAHLPPSPEASPEPSQARLAFFSASWRELTASAWWTTRPQTR